MAHLVQKSTHNDVLKSSLTRTFIKTAKVFFENVLFPNYRIKLESVYGSYLKYGYVYGNGNQTHTYCQALMLTSNRLASCS